ncbi:glycosyltransferase family 39 protein [Echinicola sp. CAU 1574]|uniref:Glycosyltransferase family 39 protein n=1 Tax=Echinicola arenosa TaxID=2774144 RepID=A0ABR9AI88_9BACT|nr:glycosyltransferase family 39 protein [Echinicola arenosa]MBD8488549.1 glycosyltransferase family 39 protein [Echinicola arenosa]
MDKTKQYRSYLLIILGIITFFKILFTATTSLSLFSEETQYWLWGQNLDWNYYSKPLMVAVYNFIFTGIFGNTDVAVRLSAVLFSAGTAWIVFELGLKMFKSAQVGFWAALMLVVMPYFHLASFFHTTDSSLLFFWALSFYWLWMATETRKTSHWVYAGLASAMGMLSKNTMVLAIPLIFVYLLLVDAKQLKQKGFYVYCLVFALSFIPIIVWNFQNDFVTFRHVGTLGGVEGESKPFDFGESMKYVSEYAGGQLGIISAFFIPFLVMSIRRVIKHKERQVLFIMLPAIGVWCLFFLISITKRVEVNWPAFAYVNLSIAMSYVLQLASSGWRKYATYATGISGVLLILIMKPAPLDAIGFKKVLRPDKDPLARLAGFREMGERIDFLIDSLSLDKQFIFSDSYHLASEMAFYVEDNPQTFTINLGRRKNQFDLWPGIEQFENQGYDGVYLQWGTADRPEIIAGFKERILKETYFAVYRGDTVKTFSLEIYKDLQHIEEVKTDSY